MKLTKKLIFASSLAMLFATPVTSAFAQTEAIEWKPRTVAQVKADLTRDDNNNVVYSIKFGDTLSVISEAIGVQTSLLANVNEITDMDLIFPETVLTTTYNNKKEAQTIKIEAPVANDRNEEALVAEINVAKNEITVKDETLALPTETVETTIADAVIGNTVEQEPTVEVVSETTQGEWLQETTYATAVEESTESEWLVESSEELTVSTSPVTETTTAAPETTEAVAALETTTVEVLETEAAPIVTTEVTTVETTTVPETTTVVTTTTAAPETTTVAQTTVYDPSNSGLQAHVAQFKDEVASMFGITSFSTYRPGDPGDHGTGLAVDFMVPVSSALGDQIAEYAISQMGSSKISYVIWKQQIYGTWNQSWTMMEDRGSITQNHYDHVHVSFYP